VPLSSLTAPDPALMDSLYIDPSTQDSRQCRSRSNSHLSSTAAQFQGLNIDSTSSSNDQLVTSSELLPTAAYRTTSPSTFPDSHPSPKTFISAPVPEQPIPFPLLSQSDLDVDWSFLSATEDHSGSAPLLRLDPAQSFPEDQSVGDHRSSFRSNSNPATMR
jgi:hypothetical protein